ncbi:MAG: hypothetical protein ABW007_02090 [Chitinophagaceae bacterium]
MKTEDLLLGLAVLGVGYYFLKGSAKPKATTPTIPAVNTGVVYTPTPVTNTPQSNTVADTIVAVVPAVKDLFDEIWGGSAKTTDYTDDMQLIKNIKYGGDLDNGFDYGMSYYS